MPILDKLQLQPKKYFLFVGRFIPDKGLHLLIEAFEKLETSKTLVLIGGSPNASTYEGRIKSTLDKRILFPGYLYGDDTDVLIQNAFAYVQPSLIEGLSPMILTVMRLGTPLICSNIIENTFITNDNAIHFDSGDAGSLKEKLTYVLNNYDEVVNMAKRGQADVSTRFNWENVTDQYISLLQDS